MNGQALTHNGQYAAFRRVNKSGDMRSNMHSGGQAEHAEVDAQMLEIVEIVRPKLVADGMFLVGLDIVGDKLMEINVFTPGGLGSAQAASGINFAEVVIRDLERKAQYKSYYGANISNVQIATI
jgi:glutathione synthase